MATVLSANLETTGGVALLDALSATTAGGHLAGQLAANVAASSFAGRLTLTDAKIAGPLTSWPVDIDQGTADISADLSAGVAGWSTLRGQARATLHDARLTGLGPNGTSPNMEGTLDATIDAGKVVLAPAQLTSPDSNVAVTGTADAAAGTIDVRLIPSGSSVVDLDGRWGGPKVTVEAKKKAASSSFLKKRTKKLLPMKAAKH